MVQTLSEQLLEKVNSFRSITESVIASSPQKGESPTTKTPAGLVPANRVQTAEKVVLNKAGMRVTYSKVLKRITLQRYLVSKIVWRLEAVTFTELLVLYDNQLWCQDKCEGDPDFSQKFGSFLEKLSLVMKKIQLTPTNYIDALRRQVIEYKAAAEDHLIPERNLITTERHVLGKFHVLPTKSSGIPTKELPPIKVIGRGYRDKGTYRDPAWDGSPSWKELATYFARNGT